MSQTLIGSTEARRLLHIERSTLTRWVQLGRIKPAQKLPGTTGAYLFHRSDIEELAAKRESGAA